MSLSKLANQIQREIKANPPKAIGLGVLGVVAVWFWLPLVMPESDTPAAAKTAPTPTPVPTATPTPTPTTTTSATPTSSVAVAEKKYPWRDVIRWIESDQDMRTATIEFDQDERSPFMEPIMPADPMTVAKAQEEATIIERQIEQESIRTPAQLGLNLRSTIVSRGRRTALINGRAFNEGDEIVVNDSFTFVVATIDSNRVVLERNKRQFVMAIRRTSSSGRLEVRNRTSPDGSGDDVERN